jgi:hypothetical protein
MIRVSKDSSLRPRRGNPARIVIRQHETSGGYGFKSAPDSSRAPADSGMPHPINDTAAEMEAVWAVDDAAVATEAVWAVDASGVGAEAPSAVDASGVETEAVWAVDAAYARC